MRRICLPLAVLLLSMLALAACASGRDVPPGPAPAAPPTTKAPARPTAHAATVLGSWSAPHLDHPTTVHLTAADQHLELNPAKDYRIVPPSTPLTAAGGVSIKGGHNVVWIGGEISIPSTVPPTQKNGGRGLYLLNQTGTIHVEGLRIGGLGLREGIDLGEPQATVQLRNLHIGPVRESPGLVTHPDVVQAWAGPRVLRIDGLTASTQYQGIFLQPQAYGPVHVLRVELHDVDITGTPGSAYLLWAATPVPLRARDVVLSRAAGRPTKQLLWPHAAAWPGVRRAAGRPHPFVPSDSVGTGYRRAERAGAPR